MEIDQIIQNCTELYRILQNHFFIWGALEIWWDLLSHVQTQESEIWSERTWHDMATPPKSACCGCSMICQAASPQIGLGPGANIASHLSRKSVPTRKMETGCCSCYQYGLILIQRFKTFKRHQKAIKDWSLQRRCQLNPRLSCLDFEHSTPPPLQGKLHWRWCTLRRMPRKAFAGGNKWEWSEWRCRMRGSKNWCRIHEVSSTFELGQKPIYCGLFGILTLLMLMLCWLMLCGWSWFFQVFSWESLNVLNCNCQMLPE